MIACSSPKYPAQEELAEKDLEFRKETVVSQSIIVLESFHPTILQLILYCQNEITVWLERKDYFFIESY